ncbi:MAG: hydrogenase expression/formation protein HypE [Haliscomenobacter sp.]|nr:hydrogenase expression/formation protein HypE [Haliscomenobacter sp.]
MASILSLDCPLPQLDFDRILLGHGSGGLLTNKLLEAGVFDLLNNDWLAEKHDGAILELSGKVAFSTDSYVVSPVFFPGGNIGELAVNGTVNDLAMCGASARYLSLSFILEEGLLMTDFWEILLSIRQACAVAGVQVVTGDTKVVERGKGDGIFINTTGIGPLHPQSDIHTRRVQPGDKILVSGPIAAHGMAILSVREGLEFESAIRSDTRPLKDMALRLLDTVGAQVHVLRDPTRGGVATTLNEIARDRRLGIALEQSLLPIDEVVASACEILGLDPLYVANEGIFLAMVSPEAETAALEVIRSFEGGQNACTIGTVVGEHPGQVVLRSQIGGKRVVGMLPGEQLPRIC